MFLKLITLVVILPLTLLAGCQGEPVIPATEIPTPTSPSSASTPNPSLTPVPPTLVPPTPVPPTPVPPTPVPADEPTPAPLTSAQIFARLSPSVAYIETRSSTGSAILVENGYLVTNAHIVWPYASVHVAFPDGTVVRNAPVVAWDLLADLAVLGPVNAPAPPLNISGPDVQAIGTEILVIGYPGAPGDPPQPTLSRGIVSRFREWSETGLTFIQSDAPIEGGQSGGVLVSETGDIIGITGYSVGEVNHGLSLASSDVAPRVESMISGHDPSGIGERMLPQTGGVIRHRGALDTFWGTSAYVIEEPVGTEIDIAVDSEGDLYFGVYDSFGYEALYVDDYDSGIEAGVASIQYPEPYFLVLWQYTEGSAAFTLEATHNLIPIPDPDDSRQVSVGSTVRGNIDYLGDTDTYTVSLTAGQTVEISVNSFLLDTVLSIDFYGATFDQIIVDDDSGGGFFGLDSRIVYRAPHTGDFLVAVSTYGETGGYVLGVANTDPSTQLTSTTWVDFYGDPNSE